MTPDATRTQQAPAAPRARGGRVAAPPGPGCLLVLDVCVLLWELLVGNLLFYLLEAVEVGGGVCGAAPPALAAGAATTTLPAQLAAAWPCGGGTARKALFLLHNLPAMYFHFFFRLRDGNALWFLAPKWAVLALAALDTRRYKQLRTPLQVALRWCLWLGDLQSIYTVPQSLWPATGRRFYVPSGPGGWPGHLMYAAWRACVSPLPCPHAWWTGLVDWAAIWALQAVGSIHATGSWAPPLPGSLAASALLFVALPTAFVCLLQKEGASIRRLLCHKRTAAGSARPSHNALYRGCTTRRLLSIKMPHCELGFDQAAQQALHAARQVLDRAVAEGHKMAGGGAGGPQPVILRYSVAAFKGCVHLLIELQQLDAAAEDADSPHSGADSAVDSDPDSGISCFSLPGLAGGQQAVLHARLTQPLEDEDALDNMMQQMLRMAACGAGSSSSCDSREAAGPVLPELQCYVQPVALHADSSQTLTVHVSRGSLEAAAAAGLQQLRIVAHLGGTDDSCSTVNIDQRFTVDQLLEADGMVHLQHAPAAGGDPGCCRLASVYVMAAARAVGGDELVIAALPVLCLPAEAAAAAAEAELLFERMTWEQPAEVVSNGDGHFDAHACSVYHDHFVPFARDLVAAAAAYSAPSTAASAAAAERELQQHVVAFLVQQRLEACIELLMVTANAGIRSTHRENNAGPPAAAAQLPDFPALLSSIAAQAASLLVRAASTVVRTAAAAAFTAHQGCRAVAGAAQRAAALAGTCLLGCLAHLNHMMAADCVEPWDIIWGFQDAAEEAAYADYKNSACTRGSDCSALLLDMAMRCTAMKHVLLHSSSAICLKIWEAAWALTPLLPVAIMWRWRAWYSRHRDGVLLACAVHCLVVFALLMKTPMEHIALLRNVPWQFSFIADCALRSPLLPLVYRLRMRWQFVSIVTLWSTLLLMSVWISLQRAGRVSLTLAVFASTGFATPALLVAYMAELPWRKAFVVQRRQQLSDQQPSDEHQLPGNKHIAGCGSSCTAGPSAKD